METNTKLALGAIPSPSDYRDHYASAVIDAGTFTLPAAFDTQLGPVQMQGQIPACVSHSIVDIIKLYFFKKTGQWVDLSPRFLDILSAEADIPLDGGRRPRTVLKVAASVGCCTTATLPNDVTLTIGQYRNPAVITQEMRDEAAKYKIPGYIFYAWDFDTTRQAIFMHGALSTLFSVGTEMYNPSWLPKDTDPLRTPAPVTSGHQMTPKGWTDTQYNRLRNEWSADWATGGETRYDSKAWVPFIHEQWAVAAIPSDLANFLHNLPAPSNFHYTWSADMTYGQTSDDIKFAQIALMILGFLSPVLPQDLGHFGPKTSAAVAAYQKANRITSVPSRIGPLTRAALNRQFAL